MSKKKKQYKDYQDYLNSPEWKALKEEFYDQYDGFTDVCQISGVQISEVDSNKSNYLCLHHWRYSKNWNDCTVDDLILVSNEVHSWLHGESDVYCNLSDNSIDTKQKYICEAIGGYLSFKDECYGVSLFNIKKERNEAIESITKLRDFHQKVVARKDNHIDLLMEKING